MMLKKWLSAGLVCSLLVSGVSAPNGGIVVKAESETAKVETESVTDLKQYENNDLIVVYKNQSMTEKKMKKKTVQIGELEEADAASTLTDSSVVVKLDSREELEDAIDAYTKDSSVAYVQPNYVYHARKDIAVTDTDYKKQWGMNNDGSYTYDEEVYSKNNSSWFGGGFTKKTQTVTAKEDIDVNAPEAWSLGTGANRKVVVAFVDTGIKYDHEDLKDKMWTNEDEIAGDGIDNDNNGYVDDVHGWNFYAADSSQYNFGGWPGFGNNNQSDSESNGNNTYYNANSEDEDSHATHCAGVVAAEANGKGVAGIAHQQNVEVMTVKVLGGSDGSGTTESVVKGIQYAADNGANICNLSLGGEEDDQILRDVIQKNANMLFCVAAGNGDYNNYQGYDMDAKNAIKEYPACYDYDNIITVANVQCDGNLHYTSNYGEDSVDIAAPGAQIYSTSTVSEGYEYMTGTSMATPMISGIAALLYSYYDNISVLDVKNMILNSSKKLSSLDGKVACGGMADAYAALKKENTTSNEPVAIETAAPNTKEPVATSKPTVKPTLKPSETPNTEIPGHTPVPTRQPEWGYDDPYMKWWDDFWNSIFGDDQTESPVPTESIYPDGTENPIVSVAPSKTRMPSGSSQPSEAPIPTEGTASSATPVPTVDQTYVTPTPIVSNVPSKTPDAGISEPWKTESPSAAPTSTSQDATAQPTAASPDKTAQPVSALPDKTAQPVSASPDKTAQPVSASPDKTAQPTPVLPTETAPATTNMPSGTIPPEMTDTPSLGTAEQNNLKKVLLKKNRKIKLTIYHVSDNVLVTWKSSKPSVATVTQNGTVTARKAGKATVTAKLSGGKTLSCNVFIRPSTPAKIKAAQVKKVAKVRISWTKLSDVDGYEILRSTSKNGTYKIVKNIKNKNKKVYNDKKVKAKTYYYKVRSYKKLSDGVKLYSTVSKVKKVKVKK